MEQSASQFALAIADPAVVVLDVRTPDEFSAGHIERAINIDIYAQDFDAQVGALDRQSTYAV